MDNRKLYANYELARTYVTDEDRQAFDDAIDALAFFGGMPLEDPLMRSKIKQAHDALKWVVVELRNSTSTVMEVHG